MNWREGHAARNECLIADIDRALAELDNLEAIWELLGMPRLVTETRSYSGGVRAGRATLESQTRELRRTGVESVLPMTLTTRRAAR